MKKLISKLTMHSVMITTGLIPCIVCFLVLAQVSNVDVTSAMEEGAYGRLTACATSVVQYFLHDIQEDILDPTDKLSTDFLDSMKAQGVELTLFQQDTRIGTSLEDTSNPTGRNIGTKCNPEIWEKVKTGQTYLADDVVINGDTYYVAYVPLTLADGTVWGMGFAGEKTESVNTVRSKMAQEMGIIGVIILLLSAVAITFSSRLIQKPMKKITGSLQALSQGELSVEIDAVSDVRDIKKIIDSAKELQQRLTGVVTKVSENTEALDQAVETVDLMSENSASGAKTISVAVSEVTLGNQSLAQHVERVSGETLAIEKGIDEINQNVQALVTNATGIKQVNMDAASYMDKVMESSGKSVDVVAQINVQIEETNKAVSKIDQAVAMITSIANQTNLLSLNASIEAARAGEAGRGFAVVADEIRELADQSKNSAEEIQNIINHVKEQSEKTVRLSSLVAETIAEEQVLVKDAQDKFDDLSEGVEASVVAISSIHEKTAALNGATERIVSVVSDLSALSEENAASSEEMNASVEDITEGVVEIMRNSDEMRGMSLQLKESVAYFKL
ncbi:MAG: methyl-accepting chemotaxis protein [Lachnospiraceae bacterium]|nr:methyl-accepting chemotaxis protein [Lachnospiraceae bacterium]